VFFSSCYLAQSETFCLAETRLVSDILADSNERKLRFDLTSP